MPIFGVTPQIRTTNIEESIDFYTSKLGMEVEFRYEDFYAGINAGGQCFHLKLVDEADPSIDFVEKGERFHLYFSTEDVNDLAMEYKNKGLEFHKELAETPWNTWEFAIKDNQGHILYFGQGL